MALPLPRHHLPLVTAPTCGSVSAVIPLSVKHSQTVPVQRSLPPAPHTGGLAYECAPGTVESQITWLPLLRHKRPLFKLPTLGSVSPAPAPPAVSATQAQAVPLQRSFSVAALQVGTVEKLLPETLICVVLMVPTVVVPVTP